MTAHPTFYRTLDGLVERHGSIYIVRENAVPSAEPTMKTNKGKADLLALDANKEVIARHGCYGVKGLLGNLTGVGIKGAPIASPPFLPWLTNGYAIAFLRHGDLRSVRLVATPNDSDSRRLPVFANTRSYEEPLIRVVDALERRSPELLRIAANSLRAP